MKQLLFSVILLSFFACKKENYTYVYNETHCSDPWTKSTAWVDPNSDKTEVIKAYLTGTLGVDVNSIKRGGDTSQFSCEACTCSNGLTVTIEAPASDEATLLEFGFVKQ